jgi:outer membrane autotransporter protein
LVNHAGAQVNLAAKYVSATERFYEINGRLLNDGTIRFGNFGQTFQVKSLANATSGGTGYYNLELDFENEANSDKLLVLEADGSKGSITGNHVFIVRNAIGNVTRDTTLTVLEGEISPGAKLAIYDETATGALSSKEGVDMGAYVFDFAVDPVTGGSTGQLVTAGFSQVAEAAVNASGMIASGWFSQLDNLVKRLGELRVPEGNGSKVSNASNATWLRAYAGQLNADLQLVGVGMASEIVAHQYGADVGYDHAFRLDNATLYLGATLGYQTNRLRFRGEPGSTRGDTDSFAAGIYASYNNDNGIYADALVKGQYFDSEYKSTAASGSFENYGVGITFEVGKRFALFGSKWFAEPSVQLDYTHLIAEDYNLTGNSSPVRTTDADVFRFVEAVRVGRVWDLGGGSFIQPAVRFGIEEQTSSGGRVSVPETFRPNTDGIRGVVGFGVSWQLTSDQQIHFDFETSFGEKLDRPWSLNAGYRFRF